jgi:hypothetical protein
LALHVVRQKRRAFQRTLELWQNALPLLKRQFSGLENGFKTLSLQTRFRLQEVHILFRTSQFKGIALKIPFLKPLLTNTLKSRHGCFREQLLTVKRVLIDSRKRSRA